MGVLPLQYPDGDSAQTLGLTGDETFSVTASRRSTRAGPRARSRSSRRRADGTAVEFDAVLRIDTPGEADYYRHGGILQYVLRSLLA